MRVLRCLVVGIGIGAMLGNPLFGQENRPESLNEELTRLEMEQAQLQGRIKEVSTRIQQIHVLLSDETGENKIFLKAETIATDVLVAPYEYSTPVRLENGRIWKLDAGDTVAVIGAKDGPLRDFWKVSDGNNVGYVQDLLVEITESGEVVSYSGKDKLVEKLAARTRSELAESVRDMKFVVFGTFPDGPDSAGGVGAKVVYRNLDPSKVIKYLVFTVTPFNAVGDRVAGRVARESQKKLKVTGPVDARPILEEEFHEESFWDPLWYNSSIACLRLDRVDIEYTDGSKGIYIKDLPQIVFPEWSNTCTF